ncbi:MAG: DUF4340 domain-containing protein [Leptolyngbya sp. SIO4C1]|nr:DUF4340 domain-containing protein [Leptolyngbya sp. SIO4C1]
MQRSTWILLVVAIALGGGVLLYENQRGQEAGEATRTDAIAPFEESAVQQLRIERSGETIAFEKDEAGDWRMTEPQQQPAEPAAIAYLLNILTNEPAQPISAAAADLEPFGLAEPAATLALTLTDESTYSLAVGDTDFSGNSRYVRPLTAEAPADTETVGAETVEVYLVSGGLSNGIERPLEEWLVADDAAEALDQPASTPDTQIEGE